MYKVMDSANGARAELGCFNTLAEAEAFRDEAKKRIEGVMAFLGKRTMHVITIEEEGS